jgi:uncharacterized membrane protein (UPF0127 family)
MDCVARNTTRGTVLAQRVTVAESLLARTRGLLGTDALPEGHGLFIRRCNWVHSLFMRYALDLVFVDRTGRVMRTVADFAPWWFSPFVSGAADVLELPAGTLAGTPTELGDVLAVEPIGKG